MAAARVERIASARTGRRYQRSAAVQLRETGSRSARELIRRTFAAHQVGAQLPNAAVDITSPVTPDRRDAATLDHQLQTILHSVR